MPELEYVRIPLEILPLEPNLHKVQLQVLVRVSIIPLNYGWFQISWLRWLMEDLSFDYQLQSSVLPSPFLIFCLESQQLFKFYCEMFSEEKESSNYTHTHTHTHTLLVHLFSLIFKISSWISCSHFYRQMPGCLPDFLDWKSDLCLYFARGNGCFLHEACANTPQTPS